MFLRHPSFLSAVLAVELGAALMLSSVVLHLAESHEHEHEAMEHKPVPSRDVGHHDDFHGPMPQRPHSH